MSEFAALLSGYLLGSIPTAYLVARWKTGRDIRHLGGGNVGGLNTFREVGIWAGILVGAVDFAKGAAAVALAYWAFAVSDTWVLLTGLAAVVGHNWMVWLKFSGGKGMGAAIGSLLVLFPLYGYPWLLLIFIGIIALPLLLTRNVALSMGIGLFALPLIVWLGSHNGTATLIAGILLVIIAAKFMPTALAALKKTRGTKDFIFDTWSRREPPRDQS